MATIITVHGTYACDPEGGSQWWQKGSQFEQQLVALIESTQGALSLQPFIWDGRNSEMSRRTAGNKLLQRALELERVAEPYCIIGHSHGGSVIELALFQAAAQGNPLPNLKQWITVGTPFVVCRRRFFLFSRLNAFGKAVYLAWMMIVAAALTLFVLAVTGGPTVKDPESSLPIFQLLLSASLFVASIIFYLVLRRLEKRNPVRRKSKVIRSARAMFGERWTSLWHEHDEAVQGLAAIKSLRVDIFARDYAVEPLSLAAVFLLPAIAIVVVFSPPLRTLGLSLIQVVIDKIVQLEAIIGPPLGGPIIFILLGLVFAFALAATAALLVLIIRVLSLGLSRATSGRLNRQVHDQVKRKAFGGDVLGEIAVEATFNPIWMDKKFAPLPDEVSREIAQFCDHSVQTTIPRLRARLASLALANVSVISPEDFVQELTWNELLHTSYFETARFCKLLACTISRADGFRAVESFRSDPDYALAVRWYDEIRPGTSIDLDTASHNGSPEQRRAGSR